MGGVKQFFTGIFLSLNIFVILIMWVCCLSTWLSPADYTYIYILGLAFPVVLLTNIAFFLFWLIFKARLVWLPLLGMLAVGSYIYDYIPMNRITEHPADALKVISYNVGGIHEEEEKLALLEYIKEMAPDILCMQELSSGWMDREDVKAMIDSLQYKYFNRVGEYIFTNLPVVGDTMHIDYCTQSVYETGNGNGSLACHLEYQGDTILLVNSHLESNRLEDQDKTEYKDIIRDPNKEKVSKGGLHLVLKLDAAAAYRAPQAEKLAAIVKANGKKNVIMCGDYNDTPISYAYQTLSRVMKSAFRDSGNGVGISYNQTGFPVRIDHIFFTKDWKSCQTRIVDKIEVSDHYPIITYLYKKQQ